MKFLAIVGSRCVSESRFPEFEERITAVLESTGCDAIVSGGARGADRIAEIYAYRHNLPIRIFRAEWNKYGKVAGMLRNSEIVKQCHVLLAIWDGKSRGTEDIIKKAMAAGKCVALLTTNEPPEWIRERMKNEPSLVQKS